MVGKQHSPEFRADAVALYLSDPGHTMSGIARDLGVSRQLLRYWVEQATADEPGDGGTSTSSTNRKHVNEQTDREQLEAQIKALRRELAEARKENQKLATERDILRKATKFFAQEMTW
jgi:transposase